MYTTEVYRNTSTEYAMIIRCLGQTYMSIIVSTHMSDNQKSSEPISNKFHSITLSNVTLDTTATDKYRNTDNGKQESHTSGKLTLLLTHIRIECNK